jgi:hypothetical protein
MDVRNEVRSSSNDLQSRSLVLPSQSQNIDGQSVRHPAPLVATSTIPSLFVQQGQPSDVSEVDGTTPPQLELRWNDGLRLNSPLEEVWGGGGGANEGTSPVFAQVSIRHGLEHEFEEINNNSGIEMDSHLQHHCGYNMSRVQQSRYVAQALAPMWAMCRGESGNVEQVFGKVVRMCGTGTGAIALELVLQEATVFLVDRSLSSLSGTPHTDARARVHLFLLGLWQQQHLREEDSYVDLNSR